MISINLERCSGCGACVEICPTGAVYLVDGKAALDQGLCCDCQDCISACPMEAITLAARTGSVAEPDRELVLQPKPEVIQVETQPAPVSLRSSLVPVLGGALAWAGREIVPWLAEYFLYSMERRVLQRKLSTNARSGPGDSFATHRKGRGYQRRRRQRRRGD